MLCSYDKVRILRNDVWMHTKCINKARIFFVNDPCFGLCYGCAYEKIKEQLIELEAENKSLITLKKMCQAIIKHNENRNYDGEVFIVRGDMYRKMNEALEALKEN